MSSHHTFSTRLLRQTVVCYDSTLNLPESKATRLQACGVAKGDRGADSSRSSGDGETDASCSEVTQSPSWKVTSACKMLSMSADVNALECAAVLLAAYHVICRNCCALQAPFSPPSTRR